jgi:hypothetical protein
MYRGSKTLPIDTSDNFSAPSWAVLSRSGQFETVHPWRSAWWNSTRWKREFDAGPRWLAGLIHSEANKSLVGFKMHVALKNVTSTTHLQRAMIQAVVLLLLLHAQILTMNRRFIEIWTRLRYRKRKRGWPALLTIVLSKISFSNYHRVLAIDFGGWRSYSIDLKTVWVKLLVHITSLVIPPSTA